MATKALSVYLGKEAARRIAETGWSPELFSLLIGASGGPKFFILSQLDRLLFGDFLQRSDQPLSVLGSSIGSWRHACLAMKDPAAAVATLEQGYLHQHYAHKPTAAEVSQQSLEILKKMLGTSGAEDLVNNPRIRTHIVTARGRGPAAASSTPLLATGMGAAALGNTLSRKLLKLSFQRVVFHNRGRPNPEFNFHDFQTHYSQLRAQSVVPALHASGSIPFVLTGERDIPGAPRGQYWDGGIVDYHFDLDDFRGEGLILYPHFSASIVPGWFDKFLPWRQTALHEAERLVLLCPSEEFVASLPQGKIPDRSDFTGMEHDERVRYWEICVQRGKALAEEFAELLLQDDPLRGVNIL
ncbi:MAG: patatin-like phospholipase family protein [Halioglobus sp.]